MAGLLQNLFRHLRGLRRLTVFHDPAYRLPLSGLELPTGIEPRRSELAVWYLLEHKVVPPHQVWRPRAIGYDELALVHLPEYLEALSLPATLAQIFAADPSEIPVDELLRSVRLACGGTLEAARAALATRGATLNSLGGFHHAARGHGGGLCAINDIAVAVATLRRDGFAGRVVVLDLDAHPPDGTADCLRADASAWIGSLSGSQWADVPGADETVLPDGCGDETYLEALDALLARMPAPELAFVIAGGDVLATDRLGRLRLTLEGARRRDARVLAALDEVPSVWLPGGGYQAESWRVLAGTGLVLAGRPRERIPAEYDPLAAQFGRIARRISPELGAGDELITAEDLADLFGQRRSHEARRLLGFYTKESVEYALVRYGLIPHIERLGYSRLRVEIDEVSAGERMRLLGQDGGTEHVLLELVVQRQRIDSEDFLFVNWLSLRHPRAHFSAAHPVLPGQDVPGLGLAREASELLSIMARRLGLAGVAFRPSWYHVAYAARHKLRFLEPERQGRFEALVRDLSGVPLTEATVAVAEGRARLNDHPYTWEADDMVYRPAHPPTDEARVAAERERCHFTLASGPAAPGGQASALPRT